MTTPSNFSKSEAGSRTPKTVLPEHYVLLCARRYAEMVRKLAIATTDDDQRQIKSRLAYIMESGALEFKNEIERRERRYPLDFRKALLEKDGSTISRSISREESEILRYANAVPAINLIDNLSADEMDGLADMFEGWAQGDRIDPVRVAIMHGLADGLRSLVEVIGADFIPPAAPPGAPVSLIKFMALKMSE
jgi:hypothetical protein